MRYFALVSMLTCSTSLLGLAAPALAGSQADPAINQPPPSSTGGSAPETAAAEIIVTGSRIARRDYSSNSPIVTLGQTAILSTGSSTVEQGLNQLPQVAVSASSSSSRQSRAGQANVDLRGLGQQRTLVLVNGRRMQPSGSDGTVDLNIIPPSLIDNVEVITGGASSTYGSDAVAGVVNIKLKQRFKGLQLDVGSGISNEGDGQNYQVGVVAGHDFADARGNFFVAVNYSGREKVNFRDRSYLANQILVTNSAGGLITAVASNLPSQAAMNGVFAGYGVAPGTVSRSATLSFNADGTLFAGTGAVNFRDINRDKYYTLYNGNVYTQAGNDYLVQLPMQRINFFGRSEFDVSDNLKLYGEGLYTHYEVTNEGPPLVFGSVSSLLAPVPVTNPFIPADFRTLLASRSNPNADFLLVQETIPLGNRAERDRYDVFHVTLGAEGKIGVGNLSWSAYASHGETTLNQRLLNYPSSVAINTLLAAPDGGNSLCAGGYNFVDIYKLSDSCKQFVLRVANNRTNLKQTVVEANLQGGLVNLPAGQVRFAVGADFRRNSYNYKPDALITAGELANFRPIYGSGGSDSVKEIYGEVLIPLLKDKLLIHELSLNAGYRLSDYRASGTVSTFKFDADWHVTSSLRFRGGFARAVRAPSVGELFAAQSAGSIALGAPAVGSFGSGDPCDVRGAYRAPGYAGAAQVRALCLAQGVPAANIDSFQNITAQTPFQTQGNLALRPEVSDTYSIGAVFRPRNAPELLSRFSITIDYYSIALKGAIGTVTNPVALSQCFGGSTNPQYSQSNYYCNLIARDPNTGQLRTIINPLLNLGGYKTSGIDVGVDWPIPLHAFGSGRMPGVLSLNSTVTYLKSFTIQTLPGGPSLDYAGTIGNQQVEIFASAHPRWKATSSIGYQIGAFQSTLRWRFIDKMGNAVNVGTNGNSPGPGAVSYFDLDLGVKASHGLEFRAGIVNLFNRIPPQYNFNFVGNAASDLYTYDTFGRRLYVSAQMRF